MKLVTTILGLMMVLTFGAISAVDHTSTANGAVVAPTAMTNCHDDGDDDLPSNPEPVDGPDSEDNLDEVQPGQRDEEVGDPEDTDPAYEADDEVNCPTVAVQTDAPSPTPCDTQCQSSVDGTVAPAALASADADCDGEVTPLDAYATLATISGVEGSPGGGCGGGDADCNDTVDAKDALAILSVVAGLETAPTCS